MVKKDSYWSRNGKVWAWNLLGMAAVVAVLIYATLWGMDVYTRHGRAVVVPDVKGMSLAEAGRMFASRGLDYVVADSNYVKTLPAGCILDYNPVAGQKVKEGRVIYLTINTLSIPLVQVPDVADNSSVRQAEASLLAAGFRLTENDSVPGEKDWVYAVKYGEDSLALGAKVPTGAILTLVIGNGDPIPLPADSLATDSLMMDSLHRILPQQEQEESSVLDEEEWF